VARLKKGHFTFEISHELHRIGDDPFISFTFGALFTSFAALIRACLLYPLFYRIIINHLCLNEA